MRIFAVAAVIFIMSFALFSCAGQAEKGAPPSNEPFLEQTPPIQATPTVAAVRPTETPPAIQAETPERQKKNLKRVDDFREPLFDHPDEISTEFIGSVSERDKRLIGLAIDITRPIFENAGLSFGADIYVAGDRESYITLSRALFDMTETEALKNLSGTRGRTQLYGGQILINMPLHDKNYEGRLRDGTLVFTVAHELYHVLQIKISKGWAIPAGGVDWFRESSANLGAWRAMIAGFCTTDRGKFNDALLSSTKAGACPDEFVEKNIISYATNNLLKDNSPFYATELYLVAVFGSGAYDRFYEALSSAAVAADGETSFQELWLTALDTAFGAPSLEALVDNAVSYIKEHKQELRDNFEQTRAEIVEEK